MGKRFFFSFYCYDETCFEYLRLVLFQVKDLTKFLDPSGLGVISFEDFYRGISAISNGGESLDAVFKVVCVHNGLILALI